MFHSFLVVVGVAVCWAGAYAQETGSTNASAVERLPSSPIAIRGVWNVTEQSSRVPGGAWVITTAPDRSLYIFTDEHYSYTYTLGSGPRPRFRGDPNKPTDSEKMAAYDSFVAAAGKYTLSDSALTLNAALHKNPSEMAGEPLKYRVETSGNQLTLTIVNPPFLPGRERRTVLTRVE